MVHLFNVIFQSLLCAEEHYHLSNEVLNKQNNNFIYTHILIAIRINYFFYKNYQNSPTIPHNATKHSLLTTYLFRNLGELWHKPYENLTPESNRFEIISRSLIVTEAVKVNTVNMT